MSVQTYSTGYADRISYEDLYSRWERSNWSATDLDFSADREDWQHRFTDFERKAALWNYSLFFWGEDAVADGLSPYIDAAPLEEQKYFLATQQVDEARHTVFFKRFMEEVAGIGGSTGEVLEATRPQLTWGFRKIFDRLERMGHELRRDQSIPKLAQAITLYHMIIEAMAAQPGQHFIERYLTERDVLPAFREGMQNVAQDEQRHIGFGVKMLADLKAMDPDEVPAAVAELLREVLPWTAALLVPPGWDMDYIECFGTTFVEIGTEGATSLETKLRSAGLPLESLPGPPVFTHTLPAEERAIHGLRLVQQGVFGEKLGPPGRDPETMNSVFRFISHGLDTSKAPTPGVLQWDFKDADPWYVAVDNGSTSYSQGRAPNPTVTFKSRYEDFVDIIAGRADPKRMLLTGRYRPKGNLRWLWKAREMFPA